MCVVVRFPVVLLLLCCHGYSSVRAQDTCGSNQVCNEVIQIQANVYTNDFQVVGNLTAQLQRLKNKPSPVNLSVLPVANRIFGKVYITSQEKYNYEQAESFCFVRGGRLVIDGLRNATLWPLVKRFFPNALTWVGISDRQTEGTWKTSDGKVFNDPLNLWNRDQPRGGTLMHCGEFVSIRIKTSLSTAKCSDLRYAMCEVL